MGLAAHDLAHQSLDDTKPLRPLVGTCATCGYTRGWTRFRCPQCGSALRYGPLWACVTALMSAATANTIGFTWELIPYLGFVLLTTALAVTDIAAFRIVDRINLRGSAIVASFLAMAAILSGDLDGLWRGLGGAAAYFVGASALFIVAGGRGFGAGDVKLAPQLGLFTAYMGWGVLGWAVLTTALVGGVIALILLLSGAGRDAELPYGPPMILGSWLAIALVGVGAIPVPS